MKILFIGYFLPARLELSYEKYLKVCGCDISRFDIAKIISDSALSFLDKNPVSKRLFSEYWKIIINKKLLEVFEKEKPDLVLVLKGNFLWPDTIKAMSDSKKSILFCFNGDDPFNLASPGASNRHILSSIPYYDCYFIWTRSLIEPLIKVGAKMVKWLPFGFDADLHYPIELSVREKGSYSNDLAFVGNWDKERERWLAELLDFDLDIWGEYYWKTRCRNKALRMRWHKTAMYGEEMSKALNSSKISLNILRRQNKGRHNMRTFEAAACGAFVLAERSAEAKEFFAEDKEAVYFSTPDELREKARYYLKNNEERNKLARKGYERCISSGYSYLERARKILAVYEKMRN